MSSSKKQKFSIQRLITEQLGSSEKVPFETRVVTFKKKTHTIEPGQIERHIYFIRSGIVQVSATDENGDEKILSFSFPGSLVCSLSSLITQLPTEYYLTCVTDCELEVINRTDLYSAMEHSVLANKIMRHFFEQAYLFRLKKQKDFLTKSAQARYEELLKEEPELVKLLSVTTLAKYLGIHSRSLSRLRK